MVTGDSSFESFIDQAKEQSRNKWKKEYSVYSVLSYIRSGFDFSPKTTRTSQIPLEPIDEKNPVTNIDSNKTFSEINSDAPTTDEKPKEPLEIPAPFVDEKKDPQSYVDRYNNEPSYKKWFDDNYPEYDSIYQAVGLDDPRNEPPKETPKGQCGQGTKLVDGVCTPIEEPENDKEGGGCLIATAAYGTELAPQVQFLREIRDNTVMGTASGAAFMAGFNQVYYLFSPTIADWERESPAFREVVRTLITPMISTMSIMHLVDSGSEEQVLVAGMLVIALNLGIYVTVPVLIGFKVYSYVISKKQKISKC